ncbi:MAG: HAMP domain-containing protein, partial [Coriobacteriaceae bacterium]|nr:HAMP domain-containing protein [Coriobacteriaceae bacterium]
MGSNENTAVPDQKKKRHRFGWSNLSYATRMTISFALIAAMTALVAIGVLSFVWDQHFKAYTNENMATVAENTADQIAKEYRRSGSWTIATVKPAEFASDFNHVRIQVFSNHTDLPPDQQKVYDSANFDFAGGMVPSLDPPSGARTMIADIVVDGEKVGYVRVYVDPAGTLLTRTDEKFRDNSYQAMVFATILAIVLAMCIGFLFARNLVKPINRMMRTANAIKEGDLSARTHLRGDDEIARLGETFDEMAKSVEKDRELERRLTTDVAHELRTPLMAIQSTVEAMVDGVFVPDTDRLETVNSEVQRLSRLVDALLRLSRLESRS